MNLINIRVSLQNRKIQFYLSIYYFPYLDMNNYKNSYLLFTFNTTSPHSGSLNENVPNLETNLPQKEVCVARA